MQKSSFDIRNCIIAFTPVLIFFLVREAAKLIAHNVVMSLADSRIQVFGFDYGTLSTFEDVTLFLQTNSVYVTAICNIICIIIFGLMMWKAPGLKQNKSKADPSFIVKAVFASICLALAVSNIIHLLGIDAASEGYQRVQSSFSGKEMAVLIICLGILAPLAEEMCFRGLMYPAIKDIAGMAPAMVVSSVCFGLIHGNIAQMLYAGALGFVLAFFCEKGGGLLAPLAGHIAVNILAVFMTTQGVLGIMYRNNVVLMGFTLVFISSTVMIIRGIKRYE